MAGWALATGSASKPRVTLGAPPRAAWHVVGAQRVLVDGPNDESQSSCLPGPIGVRGELPMCPRKERTVSLGAQPMSARDAERHKSQTLEPLSHRLPHKVWGGEPRPEDVHEVIGHGGGGGAPSIGGRERAALAGGAGEMRAGSRAAGELYAPEEHGKPAKPPPQESTRLGGRVSATVAGCPGEKPLHRPWDKGSRNAGERSRAEGAAGVPRTQQGRGFAGNRPSPGRALRSTRFSSPSVLVMQSTERGTGPTGHHWRGQTPTVLQSRPNRPAAHPRAKLK